MKNIITASIVFYFKGQKFSPSITLELDSYMQSKGSVPDLYPLIARENGFDLYSYEYELMQAEPVNIDHAEGLVTEHIVNGTLNTESFISAWYDHQRLAMIQAVIEQHGIDHLAQQHPDIEKALLEAYKLGQRNHSDKS